MKNKFEGLVRLGYASRGVVYIVLGTIALSSAFWGSGKEPSSEGALTTILEQPLGRVLLGVVAIGLIGHVLWRFAEAFLNADKHENDAKGYVARIGNAASGIVNGSLALVAAQLAIGQGSGANGSGGERSTAAALFQQPSGRWLVALLGLAIISAGIVQVWRGIAAKYRKRVHLPREHKDLLDLLCRFGLTARGVLLAVSGGFFVFAAFRVNSNEAGGLSDALDWVHQLPFGSLLYGVAALGLIAFGLYSFIEAKYREVNVPEIEG